MSLIQQIMKSNNEYMNKTYSVKEIIKGISETKRRKLEDFFNKIGKNINEERLNNQFSILEIVDEYGNQIVGLDDIIDNINIEKSEQDKMFLKWVIDERFNDRAVNSYYEIPAFLKSLENETKMCANKKPIKVKDSLYFDDTKKEDKLKRIQELYTIEERRMLYDDKYVYEENRLYEEAYIYSMIKELKRTNNAMIEIDFSESGLDDTQISCMKNLLESQANICMLLAAGGTGKTRTIKETVKAVNKSKPNYRIAVLAPTGKATCNLEDTDFNCNVIVESLHSFVGWKTNVRDEKVIQKIKETDIIIIDEASMVTYNVLYYLLLNMNKDKTKIIVVGDEFQLQAVGAGDLIGDLELMGVYREELTTDYRTQNKLLKRNIDFVRKLFTDKSVLNESADYYGLENNEYFKIADYSYATVNKFIEDNYNVDVKADELKDKIIITHQNKTKDDIAVKINELRHTNDIQPLYRDFYKGDKVMINENIHNNTGYFVVNGDTGVVVDKGIDEKGKGYLLIKFYADTERETDKKIHFDDIDRYVLDHADCITVHKSQGSQYEDVTVIIPDDTKASISINLFYTAISRAKNKVRIFVNKEKLLEILKSCPEDRRTIVRLLNRKISQQKNGLEIATYK